MKRKIFGVAIIAAIAVTAGWNFNQSKNEIKVSEFVQNNIKALAFGESLRTGYAAKECSNNWEGGMGGGMNRSCACYGSGNIVFCI